VIIPHVGDTYYKVRIDLGEFPNHHHYDITFRNNHGKILLLNAYEGLKTIF
jgi:hypothetical protein